MCDVIFWEETCTAFSGDAVAAAYVVGMALTKIGCVTGVVDPGKKGLIVLEGRLPICLDYPAASGICPSRRSDELSGSDV